MLALLLLIAALIGALIVHLFESIDVAFWQRQAMLYAISDKGGDPREVLRKLEILRGIDWGKHVAHVTTFRDPWGLYSNLPDEVERIS